MTGGVPGTLLGLHDLSAASHRTVNVHTNLGDLEVVASRQTSDAESGRFIEWVSQKGIEKTKS